MTELPVTIPNLLTLSGMTMFLYLILAAVHSAQLLPSRRFLPLLGIGLGAAIGGVAAVVSGAAPVGDAVVLGVVAGALSSGVEETRKGVRELTQRENSDTATLTGTLTGMGGEGFDPGSSGMPPED